jgi:hypothetical protein
MVATLLKEVQVLQPAVKCMENLINPRQYDLLVEATKNVCKFNYVQNNFGSASAALKIGYVLKKYAILLKLKYLLNDNESGIKKIANFQDIMSFWSDEINSHAIRTLRLNKARKPLRLPLASDLKKLHFYLKKKEFREACSQIPENLLIGY